MHHHCLGLISGPDIPAHDDGNIPDLVLSDVPMAEALVNEASRSTPDHETSSRLEDRLLQMTSYLNSRL